MKCFYHPEQDAVGLCSQCGKAACRECMEDIGGAIFCKGCIAQRLRAIQAENIAVEEDRQAIIDSAKKRIKISKIVFFVFFGLSMLLTLAMFVQSIFTKDPRSPGFFSFLFGGALGSAMTGYFSWSFYWGFPAIWNGLRRLFSKMGCFVVLNPFTLLILIVAFLVSLLYVGEFYCIFGGGIYQYLKTRKVAESES